MTEVSRSLGRPEDPALKARRVGEILDAATAMFAKRGYGETQVQAIADELGIGNGTIYRYFPTKEKLFLAAVERGLNELTASMDALLERGDPAEHLLESAIECYLEFFHRKPELAELFIQERAAFPHHHRPLYFVMKDEDDCKHRPFFEALVAGGVIRDIPAPRFFDVISDLLYGTILTNLLAGRRVTPAEQAADILDVIGYGVWSDTARRKHRKRTGGSK